MSKSVVIALTFIVACASLAGAYLAGQSRGVQQQSASAPSTFNPGVRLESALQPTTSAQAPAGTGAEPSKVGPLRPGVTAAPADHVQVAGQQQTVSQQAGAAGADPNAHFTHFRVGDRNVKGFVPDGDVMWVGTSAGVIRYDTASDQYRLFDVRTGLLANGVFHLSRLDGRLVVGTYGGGLALMKGDGEGWELFNIPDGLADAFVYDVLKADNDDVWIATWSGANLIVGGDLKNADQWRTFTVENTKGGLPNDWVYGLEKGHDGVIWFATEGGLARYDGKSWENWQHEDGLGAAYELVREQIQFKNDPAQYSEHHAKQKVEMGLQDVDIAYNPNYIVSLAVDLQGVVWSGTWGGGLARFEDGNWTNFTVADGLPGNHVFMLYEDPQGRLWIGTSNGLARREADGSFKVFTTEDGLFSNTVFAMTTAEDGSQWIGSFGGVARIVSLE